MTRVLKIDERATAKHKNTLSWSYFRTILILLFRYEIKRQDYY